VLKGETSALLMLSFPMATSISSTPILGKEMFPSKWPVLEPVGLTFTLPLLRVMPLALNGPNLEMEELIFVPWNLDLAG